MGNAWQPPASSTTCRCSSKRRRRLRLPGHASHVVLHGELEPAFQHFWQDTAERYRLVRGYPERPALRPNALFLSAEQFYQRAKPHAQLAIPRRGHWRRAALRRVRRTAAFCRGARRRRSAGQPQGPYQQHADRVLVIAESDGGERACSIFLRGQRGRTAGFDSLPSSRPRRREASASRGGAGRRFAWRERASISSRDRAVRHGAGHPAANKKQEQVSDVEALIKDLSELAVGDPIVHSAHGIGRYRGLINMDLGQGVDAEGKPLLQEMLHLEYADKATLYVPVSQLHLIKPLHRRQRRRISAAQAGLGPMGKGQAQGSRAGADSAAELLNIYARRAAREGHAFRFSAPDYEVFANDFGSTSGRPEGRDPRGDPGHESRRSRWPAASAATSASARPKWRCVRLRRRDRRQAGGLPAPTTLLASALPDAGRRFAKWPVKVAEMSRFRSAKEITGRPRAWQTQHRHRGGQTHKLLSQSVKFKNSLADHRRGAPLRLRHKEAN